MKSLTLQPKESFVYLSFGKVIINEENELFEINSQGQRKPLQDGKYALKSKGTILVKHNKLISID